MMIIERASSSVRAFRVLWQTWRAGRVMHSLVIQACRGFISKLHQNRNTSLKIVHEDRKGYRKNCETVLKKT